MNYTNSNLPKVTESWRLLKKCIFDTEGQAVRMFSTYVKIRDAFDLYDKSILELGAGGREGLMCLFDESNDVVGIDKYLGHFSEGLWKSTKSAVRKFVFDPVYKHYLKKLNNGKLNTKRKVLLMDASDIKFPDAHFDFIYSRYLLEHVSAIEKIAREIYRCLNVGGVTYHLIALYTALDGAHSLDWKKYPPWHHLIGDVPGSAYVNKYRLSIYEDAFKGVFGSSNLKIRVSVDMKAKSLLTPGKYSELKSFSREELVAGSVELVAVKST